MKKLLLALTVVLASATQVRAQATTYSVTVVTVDSNGEARYDSVHWITKEDARARRDEILQNGWTITSGGGVYEDKYPPHSIVKATVIDLDPQPPQCPPDCPAPGPGADASTEGGPEGLTRRGQPRQDSPGRR